MKLFNKILIVSLMGVGLVKCDNPDIKPEHQYNKPRIQQVDFKLVDDAIIANSTSKEEKRSKRHLLRLVLNNTLKKEVALKCSDKETIETDCLDLLSKEYKNLKDTILP